ncbi:MAG: lipid-A-disaccharide synthase [SAR324 cluster bacterium]|uniref:Lipid-A-disaccharide synthase n=1 Tax=SAR324 cluster bacterium TaxID=2024889 RepID=A0A2A4T8A9_9DELT|nr:MAG: lipid-A-disaccharide synthase [SAR324 cluster bacterium]
MNKLMVIAGEASGDLHGGHVLLELKKLRPDLEIFGTGGQLIESTGAHLYYRVEDLAVIGFIEVMKRYKYYKGIFDEMVSKLDEERPDAVFLVDYAGFNLRFAAEAKKRGIKVIFYIAPQVWAWKKNRIHKMKAFIDELIVLFPFEVDFFKENGMVAHCFGHPLLDIAKPSLDRKEFSQKWGLENQNKRISFLPGSRKNEILKHLPLLIQVVENLAIQRANLQFIFPLAPTVTREEVLPYFEGVKAEVQIVEQDTYNAVANSDFAVVASGTATLETAILQTPMLIFYKVSPLTYLIAKFILRIGDIGLPNIVARKKIVPELVQHSSPETMVKMILSYLEDRPKYQEVRDNLAQLKHDLGEEHAYANTAKFVASLLK